MYGGKSRRKIEETAEQETNLAPKFVWRPETGKLAASISSLCGARKRNRLGEPSGRVTSGTVDLTRSPSSEFQSFLAIHFAIDRPIRQDTSVTGLVKMDYRLAILREGRAKR